MRVALEDIILCDVQCTSSPNLKIIRLWHFLISIIYFIPILAVIFGIRGLIIPKVSLCIRLFQSRFVILFLEEINSNYLWWFEFGVKVGFSFEEFF